MENRAKKFNTLAKAAIPLTAVLALGAYTIDKITDFSDSIPDISVDVPNPVSLEPDPAKIEVAIDPEFITVEEEFDIRCRAQVSVAVGVRGFMNGPLGDGKMNKKIFGDFLVCSESLHGTARVTKNDQTGDVIKVEIDYVPLEVTHPRVDHLDGRNCANIAADASLPEARAKIEERNEAIKNGERPDCEDGFWVSQLGGSDDLAEIKDLSYSAAQLAITFVDPEAFLEIDKKNQEDVLQYFVELYPGAIIELKQKSPTAYLEHVANVLAQMQTEQRELERQLGEGVSQPVFASVTIESVESDFCDNPVLSPETPQCNQIVARGFDGGQVRIILSEIAHEVIDDEAASITSDSNKPLGPVGVSPEEVFASDLNDFLEIDDK